MFSYFLLVIGFVVLIKSADYLIDGASSLGKSFGLSNIFIGLTVVAFGTSAAELAVNLIATFQGNTDIVISQIVGSNIANILLILGIASIIYPITIQRNTVWKEIPYMLLTVLALTFLANDRIFDGSESLLTRGDGLSLLLFFVIFMYYTASVSKLNLNEDVEIEKRPTHISTIMVIVGCIGLFLGGKWVVDAGVSIATSWGVSEALIGLTILALGTSLPELTASIVAAYKKNADIIIGGIVGSNIFNVLLILGLSSVVKQLPVSKSLEIDITANLGISLLLFAFMFPAPNQKHSLKKFHGVIFLLLYITYIWYIVARG